RVDVPDGALGEHAVLVQRDQLAESLRREPVRQNCVRGTIAVEDAMGDEALRRAFGLHLLGHLAERQRLRLRKDVRQADVVVPSGFRGCAKAMKSQGMRRVPWWIS